MGLFGAMTTAITGLRAQSKALENISNNIANSQTVGYKRTETSFAELVPESSPRQQALGVVQAFTRATNSVDGDVLNSDVPTYVAINGEGFFVVGQQIGVSDGEPVFSEEDLYTRRGDFELDKDGFLVNGTGYALKGLPVDPLTGNTVGSLPGFIQVSQDLLPAQATTRINYRGNLAKSPDIGSVTAADPLADRLIVADFANDPTVAGTGVVTGADAATFLTESGEGGGITTYDAAGQAVNVQLRWAKLAPPAIAGTVTLAGVDLATDTAPTTLVAGEQLTLNIGSETFTIGFETGGTPLVGQDAAIDPATATGADLRDAINNLFSGSPASLNAGNFLEIQPPNNLDVVLTGSNNAVNVLDSLGLGAVGTGSVLERTVEAPETWNLFYLQNSNATGSTTAWQNIGQDYVFGDDSQLIPAVSFVDIPNLTVNGINLGTVRLNHGTNGITQFARTDGSTEPTLLTHDGFAPGEISGVSVSEDGRVVATYSNGRSIDLAEITLAGFNATGYLQKIDGGAYRATPESGSPILGALGAIIGNALEGSNTDIADEFTKLIVTQQAYAANTRVISTTDEMLQEALNIVR